MFIDRLKLLVLLYGLVLNYSWAAGIKDQHMHVTMRTIGHQILLTAGDSTSRVMPIEQDGKTYIISFENEFSFLPDDLIPNINCILEDAKIEDGYFLEVKDNHEDKMIYAYEIGANGIPIMIPCALRKQPSSSYSFFITFITPPKLIETSNTSTGLWTWLVGLFVVVLGGMFFYFNYKKSNQKANPNLVPIGNSHFDKINMNLSIQAQTFELTHKEAELLLLLHTHANETIEREVILQKVWGDDGDYVGRTLDVFVSKLRKKLELDTSLKIVNIRGVGYKLVEDV